MRFRKKPVVIDAFQWTGGKDQEEDPIWIVEAIANGRVAIAYPQLLIETLEGTMRANVGDWIIRGTKDEIYPCKPDRFQDIYEKA